MSLKSEISKTETNKNNVKQIATQIDTKLVELGGQRATNLNDVANKMGAMVKQYKKVATGKVTKYFNGFTNNASFVVNMNLDFNPSIIIISFGALNNPYWHMGSVDSRFCKDSNSAAMYGNTVSAYLKQMDKKSFTLVFSNTDSAFEFEFNWIALG